MYFNFDDYRPDTPTLPRSLTRLEVVLLTIVVYLSATIFLLLAPQLPWVRQAEALQQAALEQQRKQQELERQRQRDDRFVYMAPRVDVQAMKPPPRAELSDIDRKARTTERAAKPTNSIPFSRGNSPEKMESAPAEQPQRTTPEPSPPAPDARAGMTLPDSPSAVEPRSAPDAAPRGPAMGVIADAIRNVQKYTQKESFVNLQGGGDQDFAPAIQFDAKGVEFGPWLRRFIAQIRRNWFVPYAAMTMKGHVVVTFFVGKDGRISELRVLRPSGVDAFNNSAFNALAASNPTQPLPPEYPDDRAFFTVTFYFNEHPTQ